MRKTYWKAILWGAAALALPLAMHDDYSLMLLTLCWIWAILSSSLNLILGYTGQASLAHGAFFGIGAYASALLMLKTGLSFWVALPMAVMITGVFGLLIGLIALRTSGGYFAIVTLMFNIIVTTIIDRWSGLTEGPRGLMGIPGPSPLGPLKFDSRLSNYYLALAALFFTIFIVYQVMRSRPGTSFLAVRGNENLARAVGIDVFRTKITSFTLSTMLAGMGGVFYASYLGFISPDSSGFAVTFNALINVVIGGMGTLIGPVIGTVIMTFIMEYFQTFAEYATFLMGVVLLLFIIYLPGGIAWGATLLQAKLRMNFERKKAHATAA